MTVARLIVLVVASASGSPKLWERGGYWSSVFFVSADCTRTRVFLDHWCERSHSSGVGTRFEQVCADAGERTCLSLCSGYGTRDMHCDGFLRQGRRTFHCVEAVPHSDTMYASRRETDVPMVSVGCLRVQYASRREMDVKMDSQASSFRSSFGIWLRWFALSYLLRPNSVGGEKKSRARSEMDVSVAQR